MCHQRMKSVLILLVSVTLLGLPAYAATPGHGDRGQVAVRASNPGPPARLSRGGATPMRQPARGDGGRHGGYGRHSRVYLGPYGWGPHRYGGWYGWYGPYGWPVFCGPDYYYAAKPPHMGAIDLNIKPKRAQVYLNGGLVGRAARYDGWPGYLWVKEGTYELILVREGYETVVKDVEVIGGTVLRADLDMVRGESKPAAEVSRAAEKREAQRARLRETYGQGRTVARGGTATPASAGEGGERTVETAVALLELRVSPADAAVYLDGRFLGTAETLSKDAGTISVTDGPHTLEIMRPGYETKKTTFDGIAGQTLKLAVTLAVAD